MTWIRDVRLVSGEAVDVRIAGTTVAEIAPSTAGGPSADDDAVMEGRGGLLLPAFIDTHVHLDKALIRNELAEHDGTLRGAIDSTHAAKRAYTIEDVRRRARSAIESSVQTGTTRLRSHVDVDTIGGLIPLQGVQAAARDCADIAEVQTIAFPQEGLLRDPGAEELMVAAMEHGADVVGGMPHWETDDAARQEHVRRCFEIAVRFDADVDMHVDETDDGSVRTLAMVVDETVRRGWQDRVTVGHVCSLSAADDAYAEDVIARCVDAGVTVVANPVTNLVLQGRGDRGLVRRGTTRVRELMAAGGRVAFGQDCMHDAFYPFGRGSMLEVALISAHATHLTTAAEQASVLDSVTTAPAAAWRLGDGYGVQVDARADLQLYAAATWPEVLRLQDPPLVVWHAGVEVARTDVARSLRGRPVAPPGTPAPPR